MALLVVLYTVNVFITFTLSLLGADPVTGGSNGAT